MRFLDVVPDERSTSTNIETSVLEESVADSLDGIDDLLDVPARDVQIEVVGIESEIRVSVPESGQKREAEKSKESKSNKKNKKESSILEVLKSRQNNREEHRKKLNYYWKKRR